MDYIEITGARVHNLRDVSLKIPRDKLVVITGLSGSGKSSLAFDTIFAEAQRRYIDTLSAYARQYMGVLERPDVESIDGLSPTIAIEQKSTNRNPRSTVGTITEVYDFLRLLYARASVAFSPATGLPMVRYTDQQIVSLITEHYCGKRVVLLAPLVAGRKGHYRELFESLVKKGFTQVRIDGRICNLSEVKAVDRYKPHFIDLVVDKLIPHEDMESRIRESVVAALHHGKGSMSVIEIDTDDIKYYSKHLVCPETGLSYQEPAPHTFSFNSPQGACPQCKGLGYVSKIDIAKIIPDKSLSIAAGGISVLGEKRDTTIFKVLEGLAKKYKFSLFDPIESFPEDILNLIMYGSDELIRIDGSYGSEMISFQGVISRLEQKESENEEFGDKIWMFKEDVVCPVCKGSRLKQDSLNFKLDNKNIAEVSALYINELYNWIVALEDKINDRQKRISSDIRKELKDRVGFLINVGLDYLSLDRATRSLSGGESQRIRLATQIGSKLVNVLYILDEPSIGLHQRDNIKLINSLRRLRDEGNSVMVVEHDEEMMRSADWLVDIGPGAGETGGEILFNGDPNKTSKKDDSITLQYLKGERRIETPKERRPGNGNFIELIGARGNNLKSVDLKIPLGCFVGVSGVSGSGKSSLITETLMPILSNKFYRSTYTPLPYDELKGVKNIDKLIEIDQAPIGRTPRSNPATYTGVFSDIRKLFEETADAKIRGFSAGRFSFNVKGGRCEVCSGAGYQTIEMNFLPSVYVRCNECGGKRYKPDTLAVRYKGKSISDVLEMTITQACKFFEPIPKIYQKLRTIEDVGLGYITLGQSSTTLSGGENQRIKLAAELSRKNTGKTLYLLDEPTTGLHSEDIKILLGVLQRIVDQGNTVVIIEHNLDILKSVDYLIDMGPDGGRNGGRIIAAGTPEEVANNKDSVTGEFLGKLEMRR